jgi:phosphoserine aminotransferase
MNEKQFERLQIPKELIPADPRFTPGPSIIPTSFLDSLKATGNTFLGTSHRKKSVIDITKQLQDGIKTYFDLPDDYLIILGNGGATCLFDALSLNVVEKNVSHYVCGEFSSKWCEASKLIPGLEVKEHSFDFGEGVTYSPEADAELVCVTLNETSTGAQLSGFPELKENQLLAVDATSGGGQIPWPVNKTDFFFFSPQKVFASEGGLYVICASPRGVKKLLEENKRYVPQFLNLKSFAENAQKSQVFTTPSLTSIFFLNEQVKLMNAKGRKKIEAEGEEKAQILYNWAESKEYLSCYVKEDKFRSRTVATINVDEKLPVDGLLDFLDSKGLVHGINSYRKLGKNQFRIAFFPQVSKEDVQKLTGLLSFFLES